MLAYYNWVVTEGNVLDFSEAYCHFKFKSDDKYSWRKHNSVQNSYFIGE